MIINSAANRAYACAPVSRAWNNDNAFSEALETTENSAEDTLLASAPDKWVTKPGISFNAVKKALEYKKSLGIDDAEPTHELTAEQRDWLYSRHDLGLHAGVYKLLVRKRRREHAVRRESDGGVQQFPRGLGVPRRFLLR